MTNSMQWNPFWEANSHSINQNIPCPLCNPVVHHRMQMSLQLVPTLSQMTWIQVWVTVKHFKHVGVFMIRVFTSPAITPNWRVIILGVVERPSSWIMEFDCILIYLCQVLNDWFVFQMLMSALIQMVAVKWHAATHLAHISAPAHQASDYQQMARRV